MISSLRPATTAMDQLRAAVRVAVRGEVLKAIGTLSVVHLRFAFRRSAVREVIVPDPGHCEFLWNQAQEQDKKALIETRYAK